MKLTYFRSSTLLLSRVGLGAAFVAIFATSALAAPQNAVPLGICDAPPSFAAPYSYERHDEAIGRPFGASIQSNGNKAMNLHSILPILAVLPILAIAPLALPAPATAKDHAAYLASVATYKPMAGFNHVVGNKRFVGYFLAAPDLCRITVFEAMADDEALVVPPRRLAIDIKAADRAELDAGEGAALAIACTADADAIKIVPHLPAAVGVRLDHPSD